MLYPWHAHSGQQCKAFMTDTYMTPDYFTYYRSTRIKWACELGIETSRRRPRVLFGDPEFVILRQSDYSIEVDLTQWLSFMGKVAAMMRDDNETQKSVIRRAFSLLDSYERELAGMEHSYDAGEHLTEGDISRLFEHFVTVNCFSIFNMSIPVGYYDALSADLDIPSEESSSDIFYQSLVPSDRVLLREEMIRQALRHRNGEKINHHELKKVLPYETFDKWLFNDDLISDSAIMEKEIRRMASMHGSEGLCRELENYQNARKAKLSGRLRAIAAAGNRKAREIGLKEARKVMENLSFISAAITEEEIRHRLGCRHFVLFGRVLRNLDLDVSRSDLNDIYMALRNQ